MTADRDAAGITRNGLRVDPVKHREWQRRGAEKYATKRRASRNRARLTATVQRRPDDWPPAVRRAARKRSGGICELDGQRKAQHLHHRKLRRHGDHRIVNALHVCTRCHDEIHGKVAIAKLAGWLVPAAADPAQVTVLVAGGERVLLDERGRYEAA